MSKLTVLSFFIFVSLIFLPRPAFASSGSDPWTSFFSWVFQIPTKSASNLPSKTSSPSPTAITSPSIKPTRSPQPTNSPTMTPKPTQTPGQSSTDTKTDYIMTQINNYRKSLGLSEVKTDPFTCDFATIRAKEISTGFNHNGFNNRISSHTLPYPSYHLVTENLAETTNYKEVETLWQNSPGHAENMRANTQFICVESYGNFYDYEGWQP